MKTLLLSICLVSISSVAQEMESITSILYSAATVSKAESVKYIKEGFEWKVMSEDDDCTAFEMPYGTVTTCSNWVSFFFESDEAYESLWSELESEYGSPEQGFYENGTPWYGFGGWYFLSPVPDGSYMLHLDRDESAGKQ